MSHRMAALAAAAIACAGCAGNGEGLDENGRPLDGEPEPLEATFDSIQQNVFTPICTGCHAGAQAPVGLRLDAESSYAMLVNAPSGEVPSLRRVQPGNPDASYLIQKLEGTAAIGGRMPLNGPALPSATLAVIRQWISDGAQRPVAATSVAAMRAISPADDEILDNSPPEMLLQAGAELDLARLDAQTLTLQRSGRDGSFHEGNEVLIPGVEIEVRSASPTVIALRLPRHRWVVDSYRLAIANGAAVDLAGNALDGDADGVPGGDFVLHFEMGETP